MVSRFASWGPLAALVLLLASHAVAVTNADERDSSRRIVTVAGAVTEIVYALGAGGDVVAVDTTSTYPVAATELPKVGYLRRLGAEGVLSLEPTLLLAGGDAGPPYVLDQIRSAGVRVESIDAAHSLDGLKTKVRRLGELLDRRHQADELIADIEREMQQNAAIVAQVNERTAVFLISPPGVGSPMAAGRGTAADAMIRISGGHNPLSEFDGYKPVSTEALLAARPSTIIVSTGASGVSANLRRLLDQVRATDAAGTTPVRIVEVDSYTLGFGPRTASAVRTFAMAISGDGG